MKIGELRLILDRLAALYSAGGAKAPATDLRALSEVLAPHAAKPVDVFCAETNERLRRAAAQPKGRKAASAPKAAAPPDGDAIGRYVALLRSARTRDVFDTAVAAIKSDKTIKAPVLSEIARQYAESVTKYKSMAAAHADIEKAYIRHARFENKLR